ncbi:hypothetical protein M1D52_20190 [Olivibacter sp. SA151]|uniref:hypothetical protein n=1 Tax=Olivibacter jilunii TaxID=985016 RepID=UPI003F15149E
MDQMRLSQDARISINYESTDLPSSFRLLRPLIFQDGNEFICLFGPDLETGIFGLGFTVSDAIIDWESKLKDRLAHITESDKVGEEARNLLDASEGVDT